MQAISYIKTPLLAGIGQAVCLYFKFTLSLRDVEKILAERAHPGSVCHLDDMVVRINGRQIFMRRAVDQEGEALDVLAQKRRNRRAALKMLRKLLRNQGGAPDEVVIDGLPSLRCGRSRLWAAAHVIARVDCATTSGPNSHLFNV